MKNKTQLIELSKSYFNSDKNLNSIFATTDGNFFYITHKNYATDHGKKNKLEVFEIKRPEPKEEIIEKPIEKVESGKVIENKPTNKKTKGFKSFNKK